MLTNMPHMQCGHLRNGIYSGIILLAGIPFLTTLLELTNEQNQREQLPEAEKEIYSAGSNSSSLGESETRALPWFVISKPHPLLSSSYPSTHRCFWGFDTSASLRQASSSCAKVLGGVRGGIAGSWVNG